MKKTIKAIVIVCAASVGTVKAEPIAYHCEGVDSVYAAGIGKGEARTVPATRMLILDIALMTAEIRRDGDSRSTELVLNRNTAAPAYEGFFPADKAVFNTAIRGVALRYTPLYQRLELKYDLDGGRRFPAFAGTCS